jgi:tetratricopeptide (TPR) repeat protein
MKKSHLAAMIVAILGFCGCDRDSFAQSALTDHQITYYQQLLKRNPRNSKAYYGLGDALIRKARETGDPSYFNRAEEALKRSLELAPSNAGAMRHLAYVFYSRHEFEPAAIQARQAIEMDGKDGDTFGILGDALLEIGKYAEAKVAYEKMMQLADNLYSRSRLAGLKSIQGDTAGSIADLERAIAAGKTAKQPAESIAWTEWQLGNDYFAQGNLQEAERYYLQSLQSYPNYYRALAGLAQLRGVQKKYDEAIDLYQNAIAILPMPEYAAALGDIYLKIGRPEQARQQYDLVEYIGRLSRLNKILYNRELAYFYADHGMKPREGLELAQRELDYRRDIYAYDVVAWNLYKNGRVAEARDAIEKALSLGTRDAKLFYHAGMIYHSLHMQDRAKEYLARALSTNPFFHPVFAETAAQILKQLQHSSEIGRG